MRAYKVTLNDSTTYAGSMADAKQAQFAQRNDAGLPKLSHTGKIEEVEIPTDKAGLLAFVNGLIK